MVNLTSHIIRVGFNKKRLAINNGFVYRSNKSNRIYSVFIVSNSNTDIDSGDAVSQKEVC